MISLKRLIGHDTLDEHQHKSMGGMATFAL